MLNEFWETAPPVYKYVVFGGMGLSALGIIIIIVGAMASTAAFTFVGISLIGLGMVSHVASMMIRGRAVRKAIKAAELRKQG